MKLATRVTDDGCLLFAADVEDYTGCDSYWPDYYDSDSESDVDTVEIEVSDSLGGELVTMGTMGQQFTDGYAAWQAYLSEVSS